MFFVADKSGKCEQIGTFDKVISIYFNSIISDSSYDYQLIWKSFVK